jgi:hypothetical protein
MATKKTRPVSKRPSVRPSVNTGTANVLRGKSTRYGSGGKVKKGKCK